MCTDERGAPGTCNVIYNLPELKGMLKRDISLQYFSDDNSERAYGNVLYRNVIISDTPDILEFCNNSKILRAMIPITRKHLGKLMEKNNFAIADHRFHTPKDRKDYCYSVGAFVSITPKIWEKQARTIGNIEKDIRQYINDPEVLIKNNEEFKITNITIL